MPVDVDDKISKLSPALRRKVEARAAELIAEEMTLRELRKARKLTQVRMAKTLGVTQDSVSRLEKRSDLLLSTLSARRSRQWEAVCPWSLNSPTARRSCCPASLKTMRQASQEHENTCAHRSNAIESERVRLCVEDETSSSKWLRLACAALNRSRRRPPRCG